MHSLIQISEEVTLRNVAKTFEYRLYLCMLDLHWKCTHSLRKEGERQITSIKTKRNIMPTKIKSQKKRKITSQNSTHVVNIHPRGYQSYAIGSNLMRMILCVCVADKWWNNGASNINWAPPRYISSLPDPARCLIITGLLSMFLCWGASEGALQHFPI